MNDQEKIKWIENHTHKIKEAFNLQKHHKLVLSYPEDWKTHRDEHGFSIYRIIDVVDTVEELINEYPFWYETIPSFCQMIDKKFVVLI